MASEGTKRFMGTVLAVTIGSVLAAILLSVGQNLLNKNKAGG